MWKEVEEVQRRGEGQSAPEGGSSRVLNNLYLPTYCLPPVVGGGQDAGCVHLGRYLLNHLTLSKYCS